MTCGTASIYTREQLFELVWAQSAVQLAKQIGVSDVAIAKACRKHQIPKPPLGHWAKLAAGKKVDRPSLPVVVNPSLQTITFTPQGEQRKRILRPPEPGDLPAPSAEPPVFKDDQVSALWARLQSKPPSWDVPTRITNPHPSVSATRDELRRAKPSSYGRREHSCLVSAGHGDNPPRFDVMIGKASVDRAVRLVHTLARVMTEIGVRIETGNDRYGHTPRPVLKLFDVRLQLRVRELTTRKPHIPTPDELAEQAQYKFARIDKWDYEPNGTLRVSIANPDDRHDRRA